MGGVNFKKDGDLVVVTSSDTSDSPEEMDWCMRAAKARNYQLAARMSLLNEVWFLRRTTTITAEVTLEKSSHRAASKGHRQLRMRSTACRVPFAHSKGCRATKGEARYVTTLVAVFWARLCKCGGEGIG